ncbi:fimbrial biogenesis chaperone [Escherichia sp. TW14182]|uniref:fimbrial biogenesis chaperone n=1 Tax=Escherichia sp. TW14182 TaxID=754336 RepID=UPI00057872FC
MKFIKLIPLITILYSSIVLSQGSGVNLASTRVIFDSMKENSSLKVQNNSSNSLWLLRSWISTYDDDKKVTNFIITPPLYRIQPSESFQLRINKLDNTLPEEKESIFRINVLAIPPQSIDNKNSGLQFAINNRIKLIYRPHNLNIPEKVTNAYKELQFLNSTNQVKVKNPTPYYITMDDVKINGKKVTSINDFMVAPYSTLTIPEKNAKTLNYTTINDYGGKTPTQHIKF